MILPSSVGGHELAKHTTGVLAAADLNELLDIGDFGRHDDGCGVFESKVQKESSLSTLSKMNVCGSR